MRLRSHQCVKRFVSPSSFVFAAVLVTVASIVYLTAVDRPVPHARAVQPAEASEPSFTREENATVPATTLPPRADAQSARQATTLFSAPAKSAGPRLDPRSTQIIKASTAGQSHEGRTAVLDPRSVTDLVALRQDDPVRIPLMDGDAVAGVVRLVQAGGDGWVRIGGELTGGRIGSFALAARGGEATGVIQLKRERLAYQLESQADGRLVMIEKRLSDVVCEPLPRMENEAPRAAAAAGPQAAVPILNSRPAAVSQLYLDFDGETVTDPAWNNGQTIVAPAFNLSSVDITTIFERVKDDWWPFNINVTTDVAKYNSAPVKKRMRVIVTPNDAAAPGAGGVAYLFSFSQAGSSFSNTIPCWVFNSSVVGISEAISHELGHTMGLRHDGRTTPSEAYYLGHGSGATGWCPIMGAGYYKSCVQWSKGEYTAANNQEDDLAIISGGANAFGYIADDSGGTPATAVVLTITGGSGAVNQVGTIERTNDVDLYSFATTGGTVILNAQPATPSPDYWSRLALRCCRGWRAKYPSQAKASPVAH